MKRHNQILLMAALCVFLNHSADACGLKLVKSLLGFGEFSATSETVDKRMVEMDLTPVCFMDGGIDHLKRGSYPISRDSYPTEYEAKLKSLFGYAPNCFFDGEFRNPAGELRFGKGVRLTSLGAYEIGGVDIYQLSVEVDAYGGAKISLVTDRQNNLKKQVKALGVDQGLLRQLLRSAKREYLGSVQVPGGRPYVLPSNVYRLRYEVSVDRNDLTAFMLEFESILKHSDRHF